MKQKNRLPVWLSLLFTCCLISCASVVETKLNENSDFVKNAEKFLITSPLSHSSSIFSRFILEDVKTKNVYEIKPQVENPIKDSDVLEEYESGGRHFVKTQEFTSHKFFLSNPLDNREYEVIGKTTYYISGEEYKKTSSQSGKMIYPVEFWIFEQGKDAGKIILKEPSFSEVNLEILLHDKTYNIEYQNMFNDECYTLEDENGLMAIIGFKRSSGFTTKKNGEIYIKQGLSEDLKSDTISMYILAATMLSITREAGI